MYYHVTDFRSLSNIDFGLVGLELNFSLFFTLEKLPNNEENPCGSTNSFLNSDF